MSHPAHRQGDGPASTSFKGKKIALIITNSPYGKGRSPLYGVHVQDVRIRVPADPGDGARQGEQKSHWCRSASTEAGYVRLWGWGIMNSAPSRGRQRSKYPSDIAYSALVVGRRDGTSFRQDEERARATRR